MSVTNIFASDFPSAGTHRFEDLGCMDTFCPPKILKKQERIDFDASNKAHRAAWVTFNDTGHWPVAFNAEWPHVTVPGTVLHKIAEWACRGSK